MVKYRYHRQAERELEEAADYYQEKSQRAASNFLRDYENSLHYILNFPEGTSIIEKLVRPKSLLDFPFTIHYMFYDNIVYIVAVAHQSRRPGYWKGRIKDARFD